MKGGGGGRGRGAEAKGNLHPAAGFKGFGAFMRDYANAMSSSPRRGSADVAAVNMYPRV